MKSCNCLLRYSFWASFSACYFIRASNFSSKLKLELMIGGFYVGDYVWLRDVFRLGHNAKE